MTRRSRKRFPVKFAAVWGVLGLLAVSSWMDRKGIELSNQPMILGIVGAALGLAFIAALFRGLKRASRGSSNGDYTFKDFPWVFNNSVITISGTVEHILPEKPIEIVKRKLTDRFRKIIRSENHRNRYVHQRFLLSSSHLKNGKVVLVEHNTNYGKVPIRTGDEIEVQGVYLHTVKRLGKNFYGRIHHTHKPKGYLRVT